MKYAGERVVDISGGDGNSTDCGTPHCCGEGETVPALEDAYKQGFDDGYDKGFKQGYKQGCVDSAEDSGPEKVDEDEDR